MASIRRTTSLALICSLFIAHLGYSQAESQALTDQYDHLIEKSETYAEYKVIKKTTLDEFWAKVEGSVKDINTKLSAEKAKVAKLERETADLNKSLIEKDNSIASLQEEKASISVLGISFDKTTYAVISVFIPLGLIVAIGLILAKFKADSNSCKAARTELAKVEAALENHKAKALETQIKLKRELQTERNKLMELAK